jgi:MYXO-CTERM domain-containing protein
MGERSRRKGVSWTGVVLALLLVPGGASALLLALGLGALAARRRRRFTQRARRSG